MGFLSKLVTEEGFETTLLDAAMSIGRFFLFNRVYLGASISVCIIFDDEVDHQRQSLT